MAFEWLFLWLCFCFSVSFVRRVLWSRHPGFDSKSRSENKKTKPLLTGKGFERLLANGSTKILVRNVVLPESRKCIRDNSDGSSGCGIVSRIKKIKGFIFISCFWLDFIEVRFRVEGPNLTWTVPFSPLAGLGHLLTSPWCMCVCVSKGGGRGGT